MNKIKILFLLQLLLLISCNPESNLSKQVEDNIEKPFVNSLSYTFQYKGINDSSEIKVVEEKLKNIFAYLSFVEYSREMTIKFTTFTKLDQENNMFYIDYMNITDFDLVSGVLRMIYSDAIHYGLMYGFTNDILDKLDMDYEAVVTIDITNIDSPVGIELIFFHPKIAQEEQIKVAKYLSSFLVDYINESYTMARLDLLLRNSSSDEGVKAINGYLLECMEANNFSTEKVQNQVVGVFKQLNDDNFLSYINNNIHYKLSLSGSEKSKYLNGMNESIIDFYRYIEGFNEEVDRLEEVFDVDHTLFPLLNVEVYYKNVAGKLTGYYNYNDTHLMELYTVCAFSHEYIHYLDHCRELPIKYNGISEIRAVYYSMVFELEAEDTSIALDEQRDELRESADVFTHNPVRLTETITGRDLNFSDYNLLFNDIYVHEVMLLGASFPDMYYVDYEAGYPIRHWRSLMNFLIYEYGPDSAESIMIYDKLFDGEVKRFDSVIEEWKNYIINLNEEDYMRYY